MFEQIDRAGGRLAADAPAPALFVLGPAEGLPLLAGRFPGVEALFLARAADGGFDEIEEIEGDEEDAPETKH